MTMLLKRRPKQFYSLERDGVTQSLLSMFLSCRQKARLYLEGWESKYHSTALLYGSLGHGMLEKVGLRAQEAGKWAQISEKDAVRMSDEVESAWRKENPRPSKEALRDLEYSLAVLEKMLPVYSAFWRKADEKRKWLRLERGFAIPHQVKGEPLTVRGKMDGEFESKGLWLQENKFKSVVSEGSLMDTLTYEFQVFLYIWALASLYGKDPKGLVYNVVRRPGIREAAGDTPQEYAKKVMQDVMKRPSFYFMRFEVAICGKDLEAFKKDLAGVLLDFVEWAEGRAPHYKNTYECLGKYGKCPYLEVCSRGDYSQLAKRPKVFRELEDY